MQAVQRRMIDVYQANATVRDVLMKNKTRKGQRLLGIQSYTYATSFAAVAAAASPTQNIQTQGDSDFLILYIMGAVFNNATQAAIATPFCRLFVSDNSSNRSMMNVPCNFYCVTGTGSFPYLLQDPRLIPASTQIQVQFFNDMSVGPVVADATVMFGGYRAIYAQ